MKFFILPSPCALVTESLLGPNTLFSLLFSNTLSLRSSLSVRDQVSHDIKRNAKLFIHDNTMKLHIVLY